MVFKTGPIIIQRDLPIGLDLAKAAADKLLEGVGTLIRSLPGSPAYVLGDWDNADLASSRDLKAGRVLHGTLSLFPTDSGTQATISIKGTCLLFARDSIESVLRGALDAIN